MEQSVELQNLADRLLGSFVTGDIAFVENMFSKKEGVLAIGSDPDEWGASYSTIVQMLKDQVDEISGAQLVALDTQAYSEGSAGWAVNRYTLKMADDVEIPFRATSVFHREEGEWKIVQRHTSVGVPNAEVLGQTLTPPILTGARQTMSTWATVIESYDAVPEAYKGFFKTIWQSGQPFPYAVLTPVLEVFGRKTTEKLVCEVNDTLYVVERTPRQVVATGYPLATIRDVEVGAILLHSWITISGVTTAGVAGTSTFEFNAATGARFAPFVDKIRAATNGSASKGAGAEQAKFDYLATLNFKFMNYAKSSLMGSAKVLRSIWQPEIRASTLPVGPFYKTVCTSHLTILTDKELILIWDDERVSGNKRSKYGGVWRYIPLRNIVSVTVTEQANDLVTCTITLSGNDRLDRVFAASNKQALEQFQSEVKKLIR